MLPRLFQNSISNVTVTVVRLAISFVLAPVIVRGLGNHDYGIWEFVAAITGYMGILEIGLQPAIVRYVAKYNAVNDADSLRRTYSSTLLYMGGVGLVVSGIMVLFAFIKPGMIAAQDTDARKYFLLLLIIGAQMMAVFPGNAFECFHAGFQRYQLKNAVSLTTTVIASSLTYMVLKKGYGLLAFASIGAATTYANAIVFWMLLRLDRYGHYRFRRGDVSKHSLIELFRFGSKVLLLGIAEMVSSASAPIVIGVFLSPVAVTFYAIPSNLLKYVCGIISSITIIYMPFFSDLHARQDKNRSIQTFASSSRYVIAVALLFLGGVLFLGVPFLRVWMGAEYAEKGKWVLSVLVFAYLTGFLNPIAGRFLTGIGRLEVVVKYVWCLAATNIILSVVLIGSQGITGVALGSAIAGAIFQPAILALTLRHVEIKFREYARTVLLPLAAPLAIFCIVLFVLTKSIEPASYFDILYIAASSTIVYLVALWFMTLRHEERSALNEFGKRKVREFLA